MDNKHPKTIKDNKYFETLYQRALTTLTGMKGY